MPIQNSKKKLCWNCDGSVPVENENCPYCAVYVGQINKEGKEQLFNPPYSIEPNAEETEVPKAPYIALESNVAVPNQLIEEPHKVDLVYLSLFLAGTVFSLFGFILWLFSENNVLTLRWDATYWFVYLLAAIPMLILGTRSLK